MTQIGTLYGQAIYDLARDEFNSKEILEQLQQLNNALAEEPDFVRVLTTPNLSKEERCRVVDESFREIVHPYVLNFMKILTEKGYMRYFSDCYKTYRDLYYKDHGILVVKAVTASALNADQTQRLKEKLVLLTGKNIELENRVDPGCLGGIRLDYDGKRLDDTVSHRLESVADLLKNTVL